MHVRSLLLTLMFLIPSAHLARGDEERGASQDELLLRAAEQYSQGYLEDAWDSLSRFHRHPKRNEIDLDTFMLCFAVRLCPQVPQLAQVLGKSREDASFIRGFCPQTNDWRTASGVLPKGFNSWQQYSNLALRRFLFQRAEDCESWYEDTASIILGSERSGSVPESRKTTVPHSIRFYWDDLADEPASRPLVTGRIGSGRAMAFLVDTAATYLFLYSRMWDSRFDPLLPWLTGKAPYSPLGIDLNFGTYRGDVNGRMFRAPNPVSLEDVEYSNAIAVVLERNALRQPFHVRHDRFAVLGQSLLLRQERLCFDWQEERLHLGELGPCADGIEIDDALLRDGLNIYIASPTPEPREVKPAHGHAHLHDPNRLGVLIDTGSTATFCSQRFVDLNDGSQTFSLSNGSGLTATCHRVEADSPLFHDDFGYSGFPLALIGMDTLKRFRAFGWELAPLRLYFVTREEQGAGIQPLP